MCYTASGKQKQEVKNEKSVRKTPDRQRRVNVTGKICFLFLQPLTPCLSVSPLAVFAAFFLSLLATVCLSHGCDGCLLWLMLMGFSLGTPRDATLLPCYLSNIGLRSRQHNITQCVQTKASPPVFHHLHRKAEYASPRPRDMGVFVV